MRIVIIGAGAWGTAMAVSAARHTEHLVLLWARDARQVQAMQAQGENARYLAGVPLPGKLTLAGGDPQDLRSAVDMADLVVVATPMSALRGQLEFLQATAVPTVWLCKGMEPAAGEGAGGPAGLLPHEVQRQVAPHLLAGALSGPSFAQEVARGQPCALVAASRHRVVRETLVRAFHGPTMRIYENSDILGVEIGSAVKNVLAIAIGLADGLELGLNARAALITRGLAEMSRLGVALGANAQTFLGLSGVGDLVLTATGNLSRNRRVGLQLAEGRTLPDVLQSLGHVAEGVYCAQAVLQRARARGVDMPITECTVALLAGRLKPVDAVGLLMEREPSGELR